MTQLQVIEGDGASRRLDPRWRVLAVLVRDGPCNEAEIRRYKVSPLEIAAGLPRLLAMGWVAPTADGRYEVTAQTWLSTAAREAMWPMYAARLRRLTTVYRAARRWQEAVHVADQQDDLADLVAAEQALSQALQPGEGFA